jgi:integrase
MAVAKKLTQIAITKIRPAATRREVPDGGKPSGKKSWAVRYRFRGQSRKYTLPGFPSLPLAHRQAQVVLDQVAEGLDPAAEKRRLAAPSSDDLFRNVAANFIQRHVKQHNSIRYGRDVTNMLAKDILPSWGDRRIQDIGKRDVLELLHAIAARGGGLSTNRTLSIVKKLFAWAIDQDIVSSSPAASVKKPVKERSRDRVLGDEEIKSLWLACDRVPLWGPITKILLLTGQRRGEVGGMTWDELDLDKARWSLPAVRTKNGKAHEVPLSDAAVAVIREMPRHGPYVFTTGGARPIGNYGRGKAAIDHALEQGLPRWTFHDLRRTVATGMAKLHIPLHVTEAVLNHVSGSLAGVAGVYNRHDYADEKRQALEAWARFVLSLETPSENVVQLRAAQVGV